MKVKDYFLKVKKGISEFFEEDESNNEDVSLKTLFIVFIIGLIIVTSLFFLKNRSISSISSDIVVPYPENENPITNNYAKASTPIITEEDSNCVKYDFSKVKNILCGFKGSKIVNNKSWIMTNNYISDPCTKIEIGFPLEQTPYNIIKIEYLNEDDEREIVVGVDLTGENTLFKQSVTFKKGENTVNILLPRIINPKEEATSHSVALNAAQLNDEGSPEEVDILINNIQLCKIN